MRRALSWMAAVVLCCAAGAAHGEAGPEEARAAYERANGLYKKGRYSEALVQGEGALRLWEASQGSTHPEVARCLDLLGVLHRFEGDAARAESLLQRGLALREALLGGSHPDVAASLDHLASLYSAQGAYDQASPLYERALAILEASPGKDPLQAAGVLNNLARLYSEQGLYVRAEPLHQRALAIQEAVLGPRHPDLVSSLNNLASLYLRLGSHKQAEALAWRALGLQHAAFGTHHPSMAPTLHNLALCFTRQGKLDRAEQRYQRAVALVEFAHGRNHPYVAELLNGLAQVHMASGRLEDALPLLRRAFAISELQLRREVLDLSESRLARFIAQLRTQEDLLYSLARAAPDDEGVRHLALTVAHMRKGRTVEQLADTSRTAYRRVSDQDRKAFQRLRGLRSELASLSLQRPDSLPPGAYRERLRDLAEQGDALEAELALRSAPLRALTSLPPAEEMVGQVAAALPRSSVLVEFVTYMDVPLPGRPGTLAPRYLALVLFPSGRISASDLGPAERIDHAAARMRDALARRDADYLGPAQELYQLVLRPMQRLLDGVEQVFVSPDGQLGLVPFAALHNGREFLVDVHDFTYLNSGRDLLPRAQEVAPSQSVVVLADPAFNSPGAPLAGQAPALAERSAPVERFFSTLRADVAALPWTPLPGTRKEAEAIQRRIPHARLFLGAEATKERLLHVSSPGILHLATHGFFLEDSTAREATRAVTQFPTLGTDLPSKAPADPLLRSGLVLAGVSAPAPGATRPPLESTMVTALELAGLNLWGTQLVVLSACDTGRGAVKPGQGVYGLRRAFTAAGAETVVMSLWKVDDEGTRLLMAGYYRNLLAGQGRATALHRAMLEQRRTRPHPHYWAPFIAAGRNLPLRALAK